jgi:aspartate beta-hydroxylase
MEREPPDAASEVVRLEHAVRARPLEFAAHEQLAQAHRRLLDGAEPESKLAAIVDANPFAFTSVLLLARVREGRGDLRRAQLGYMRAVRTAQLLGFWFDEASTPVWLRQLVIRAMDTAQDGRVEIFDELLAPMVAKYGDDELSRVVKAVAMYVGIEATVYADARQRPTFFYIPDLPVAPQFPRDVLPFADWCEAHTDAIVGELHGVLDSPDVQPFHYDLSQAQQKQLARGWDAYFFYEEGERVEDHHAACPRTSAVLAGLPLDHVPQHGPEVCFSIMRPGAHIAPHRGVTNARAVLHLGLEVPEDCLLHLVDVQQLAWQRGQCWAFDDTFTHEAWNRSSSTRSILLADIWNPYLRQAEREVLAELIALIGDFNRSTAPVLERRA